MKKYFIIGIIVFGSLALAMAISFYWQNLRGVQPALKDPAPRNVQEEVPQGEPALSTNTTGIPLVLPSGFSISVFAENVPGARVMMYDTLGRLIVSETKQGRVVALPDENVDGKADKVITLAEGLKNPHGLEIYCEGGTGVQTCKMLVAEEDKVSSYDFNQGTGQITNKIKLFDLPSGSGHYTRTIKIISTDEGKKLLTSIGSSCNVCFEKDNRRASVFISNLDGTDFRPFASGLRNSVFMAIRPNTDEIWATEMGRDLLGDDTPPDEINILKDGFNYGWPVCYGTDIHDTNFDKNQYIQNPCNNTASPQMELQAHSAPLGLAFIPDDTNHLGRDGKRLESWPLEWKGDLLVAYHGSWNRSVPTGYKIVRFDLDENGKILGSYDFITGFLRSDNKSAYGRPVDILALPGGYMFVSDDHAGLIYRIQYKTVEN